MSGHYDPPLQVLASLDTLLDPIEIGQLEAAYQPHPIPGHCQDAALVQVTVLRVLYRLFQVYLFFVRPLTLGVRVMMIRDGEVLLVRQTYMDGWFMPGGRIEKNETTEQAARREANEEVGARLHSLTLLGVYSSFKEWKSDHNVLFLSDDFELSGGHDREIAELRFFPLTTLPHDVWPGHKRRLLEYREHQELGQESAFVRFGEW